jgi:hypothetical protein
MHDIDLLVQCFNRYREVLSDDVTTAECMIEELFAGVLSTFFEFVVIERVALTFWPTSFSSASAITLFLRAQGEQLLLPIAVEHLDCAVEERLLCTLGELFGSLNVERFALR